MTLAIETAAALPSEILKDWKTAREAHEASARRAASALEAERSESGRLRSLAEHMAALERRMAVAPVDGDSDLLTKLELWSLLVDADADDDRAAQGPAVELVRSVAADLAARRAA
ncbi:MAG: hypothetical protein AAGI51_02240 [Pseudomonadota bacterium]